MIAKRRPRTPRGLVVLAFATAAGAALGAAIAAGVSLRGTRNPSFSDFAAQVETGFARFDALFLVLTLFGAVLGFLIGGGVPRIVSLLRGIGAVALLLLGGLVGATVGVLTYRYLWLDSFADLPFAFASASPVLLTTIASGAIIGLVVTTVALGTTAVRKLVRGISGVFLGAFAGLAIFSMAFVVINHPALPRAPNYLLYFGEAVYSGSPIEFLFMGLGAALGLLVARNSWRFYGVVTLVSLVFVVVGFLGYSLLVTLPKVEPSYRALSISLFVAETASLTMVVLYAFYTIDVATRKRWIRGPASFSHSKYYLPRVALQVPTFNEPPELVFETLESLLRLDYPSDRYLIMVLDDSTRPECAKPLKAFCKEHGIRYYHREDRKGYKAGALNHALEFVPDDVELCAVVDADYQVLPDYLDETVGYFISPDLGWVQTPQDYRNRSQSFLTEQYYLSDAYFYRTVMPSRNEENTIIFCGTMGIVRKDALLKVGRWGEKYISEDAELSLRLLLNGYDSVYINKTYGRGLIPATFEGYKKQHYRWAFGGAKILKGHAFDLVVGRLSRRQTFDYFVGSVHWFDGVFILLIALALAILGLGEVFEFRIATHHSQEILLVGLVPIFLLLDGLTRLHMVMRQTMRLSLRRTLRVLGMWFSVKFSNAQAATKALVGFRMPFVRTPKAPDREIPRPEAFTRALRVAPFESAIAFLLFLLAAALGVRMWVLGRAEGGFEPARAFLAAWIVYYGLIFFCAPLYAYRSYVTFRPEKKTEEGPPAYELGRPAKVPKEAPTRRRAPA